MKLVIKVNIKPLLTGYILTAIAFFLLTSITVGQAQTNKKKAEGSEPELLSEAYEGMFKIGVALNRWQIGEENSQSTPLIAKHFNTITPENLMKWSRIHPQPNEYSFEAADRFVEFGEKHDMFIVGHTLVWHSQIPDWTFEDENGDDLSREALLQRMKDHISTVVGRYKGRVDAWDVLNEAATWSDGLRKSKWLEIIGEEYINKAFEYAHEADPGAELYYNDYNLWAPDKRETVVKMVRRLQQNDVPIHGVGMQAHLGLDSPSLDDIEASIKAFSELGVKVMITELDVSVLPSRDDVNVSYNPDEGQGSYGDVPEELNPYKEELSDSVQQQLRDRYVELFELFKKHQDKIDRVTFWGLNDRQSWLNNFPIPGRTDYPLLFNRNNEPKPAFQGVLEGAGRKEGIK
ncbi:endo-1,4-beta-xylanase [Aliifodinibius sp. S!AR15-10]|uniref:endo-1,4-beta-xylanase n=1 Tax=Aliifodinibius sp. S!AR15-10 TaxID=2950437 RepID=UPI0028570DED|nr:endo-1,4-beta-xylanase [Aliifodinibius sp. S!AR15-10]MDR8393356.1 endo-1,4-beta-xylanase [Aliifodinibius sp. S!AR15-10]